MSENVDMSKTIIARSDQLNSDDLIGGPLTCKVTRVFSTGNPEQPVGIDIDSWHVPYKPCKGMRRVLVEVWGTSGNDYVGKSLTLYRNPDVKYGGIACGGIEISEVSDISSPRSIPITVSRGKKKPFIVKPLKPAPVEPKANKKEIEELRQKMVIESEDMALGSAMGAVSDTAGMDAVRATFSRLSSKLTAEQRTALVALADAAKARIASVPVVPAEVAAAGKGELV